MPRVRSIVAFALLRIRGGATLANCGGRQQTSLFSANRPLLLNPPGPGVKNFYPSFEGIGRRLAALPVLEICRKSLPSIAMRRLEKRPKRAGERVIRGRIPNFPTTSLLYSEEGSKISPGSADKFAYTDCTAILLRRRVRLARTQVATNPAVRIAQKLTRQAGCPRAFRSACDRPDTRDVERFARSPRGRLSADT